MKRLCPYCKSDNIIKSQKSDLYVCLACWEPFESPHVVSKGKLFLSYGHDSCEIAEKIKDYLNDHDYDVWIDSSQIPSGKDWREKITQGIHESDQVVSLVSKHAMRENGVCLDELRIALCLRRSCVQTVLLESMDEHEIPAIISHRQRVDMRDWKNQKNNDEYFQRGMAELLKAIQIDEVKRREEQLKDLLLALTVSDNTVKEDLLTRAHFVGREWLRDEVGAWLNNTREKAFVIYGVPGAGKSAFAADLSLTLPEVFASMFFKWNSKMSKDVDSFTRLLALKLAMNLNEYRENLHWLYKNEAGIHMLSGEDLFEKIIIGPLIYHVTGNHETGMIIFDGLDEASPEIVSLITNKLKDFPNEVKILFTCRREAGLASRLDGYKHVVINDSREQNLRDIRTFLCSRLKLPKTDERIAAITEKTEGSFMYAVTFCDSVLSGHMSIDDISTLPSGLKQFYRIFFERLFPDVRQDYEPLRPFIELLCLDGDMPAEVLSQCLGITDDYQLSQTVLKLKSLLIETVAPFSPFNNDALLDILPNNLKIYRFAHQTVKEWLTDPMLSAEYYIIPSKGYARIADFYETEPYRSAWEEENGTLYLDLIINCGKKLEDPENTEDPYLPFHSQTLKKYGEDHYIKWLILCKRYDKAKNALLASFSNQANRNDPIDCTDLFKHWQWADLFPSTVPIEGLVQKLRTLVQLIYDQVKSDLRILTSISEYNWRNIGLCIMIINRNLDSGRFAPVFFKAIRCFFPYILEGNDSDDVYSTRMKKDFTYIAADCLQKLDSQNARVPEDVRRACHSMISKYL